MPYTNTQVRSSELSTAAEREARRGVKWSFPERRQKKLAPRSSQQAKWISVVVFIIGMYVASQMIANVTSLRIVMVGGLSIDAGTLIYPFTFTIRDLVHRVAGKSAARAAIITAAFMNLMMTGLFQLTAIMPPDMSVGAQETFGEVLSPAWRIVIASIITQIIAELIDTEVYHAWVKKFKETKIWGRVLISNAVSVPIDSVLFVAIAFYGLMPMEVLVSIVVANILIKMSVTVFSIPAIYLVKVPAEYRADNNIEE